MNVWLVNCYDTPHGSSSRSMDYAHELHRLGHNVTLIVSSFNHFTRVNYLNTPIAVRHEIIDGVHVVHVRSPSYTGNGFGRAWSAVIHGLHTLRYVFLASDKPDIVIGPSVPLITGLFSYVAARLCRASFVFEVRDVWPQELIDLGVIRRYGIVSIAFRIAECFLYRVSRHIITALPFSHDHIQSSGRIQPGKVTYIPNGVNLDRFTPWVTMTPIRDRAIRIMYAGGFSNAHGTSQIINGFAQATTKAKRTMKLLMVGSGHGLQECLQLAKSVQCDIEFVPPVSKSNIPSLLLSADILVAAFQNSPMFKFGINSNKVFDYLAAGRPIIISGQFPNNPVVDAEAGISTVSNEPEAISDAIIRLAELPESTIIQMGIRGRQYAERKLSTRMLAAKYHCVICHLFHRTKGRR